ncbi:CMP/dCMP deaminase zinc-binding protein [Desulfurobacterium thermolithotrophum DSM 11699]|uniref:CMP/dCMP deaminase zinc-binding protein n=1 Tax=Desulfurobacterium thermolithotrophum (strain DSM 11699 / BSA) TaxID=868864 RepID=F0S3E4_DESTD|nr:dCMP deaminase family protein [Desulfurobacterium thermolithotrophum]ADY73366.1 CMP/dCMP deaminase zinc-binding protein [Desulfurobacterium thermolithotrophum DSM 11699]
MPRPSWDEYFMSIAEMVSTRSTCIRRKVGAVLVKDKRIIATGYNGPPSGLKHPEEVGCLREKLNIPSGERHELCRGLHAEQNAIIQAALHGVFTKGSILYCTHCPCSLCTKMLINAGVVKVIYKEGYPDQLAKELAAEANLPMIQFKKEED